MSENLNKTGFNNEQVAEYATAEKMYREALDIKKKNLGPNDPDTLAQYGELARLKAAQGKSAESAKLYEYALASFRKLPIKDERYSIMLQSYADMLSHAHNNKKADQIYAEASTYALGH